MKRLTAECNDSSASAVRTVGKRSARHFRIVLQPIRCDGASQWCCAVGSSRSTLHDVVAQRAVVEVWGLQKDRKAILIIKIV